MLNSQVLVLAAFILGDLEYLQLILLGGLFGWLNLVEIDCIIFVDDVQDYASSAARARSSGSWYPSQTSWMLRVRKETVLEAVRLVFFGFGLCGCFARCRFGPLSCLLCFYLLVHLLVVDLLTAFGCLLGL